MRFSAAQINTSDAWESLNVTAKTQVYSWCRMAMLGFISTIQPAAYCLLPNKKHVKINWVYGKKTSPRRHGFGDMSLGAKTTRTNVGAMFTSRTIRAINCAPTKSEESSKKTANLLKYCIHSIKP